MDPTDWRGLSEYFRLHRGRGLTYRTVQAWQTQGMPFIKEGGRYWYDPVAVFAWWTTHFAARRAS